MQVLTRDYPDYEHNINPNGLTLAKLGDGGNAMTDGCNTARKFNGMMCDTIKRVTLEHRAAVDQGTYIPKNEFLLQSLLHSITDIYSITPLFMTNGRW